MLNEVRDVTKTTQKEKGFKRPWVILNVKSDENITRNIQLSQKILSNKTSKLNY